MRDLNYAVLLYFDRQLRHIDDLRRGAKTISKIRQGFHTSEPHQGRMCLRGTDRLIPISLKYLPIYQIACSRYVAA